ncbi:MAG: hypothetical protein R3A44_13750 [Caldilineaceae bacterium]
MVTAYTEQIAQCGLVRNAVQSGRISQQAMRQAMIATALLAAR